MTAAARHGGALSLLLALLYACPGALTAAPPKDASERSGSLQAAPPPAADVPRESAGVPPDPALSPLSRLVRDESAQPVLVDAPPGPTSARTGSDWGVFLPFLGWTGLVLILLGAGLALVRRLIPAARLRLGGDAVRLLIRRSLSSQHTVYLVEVGPRLLVLGATKTGLAPLAEFRDPEEIARLKARCPGAREESVDLDFQDSLRAGLRQYERAAAPPAGEAAAESARLREALSEIEEIKKMMASWK